MLLLQLQASCYHFHISCVIKAATSLSRDAVIAEI